MPPKGKGRGRGVRQQQQGQEPPGQEHPRQESQGVQQQQRGQEPPAQEHPRQQSVPHQAVGQQLPPAKKEKTKFVPVNPEEINIEFKEKCIIEPDLPRDPGPGKLGRPINLIANHFKINLPSGYVYHYDVEISSKRASQTTGKDSNVKYRCLNTKRNREVVDHMVKTVALFKKILPAYDGKKNLFTREPLNINQKVTFPVELIEGTLSSGDERIDKFEVEIQPVVKKETKGCAINLDMVHAFFEGKISSVPRETYMALETILRSSPCKIFFPVYKSFYYPPAPDRTCNLGGGKEIWFGYHQSLCLGQWGPTVNLDTSATTFYRKGPVLQYISDLMHCRTSDLANKVLSDADVRRLSKELKTMQIEVTHLPYRRKYRILSLTREQASRIQIQLDDGNKSVATYFATKYKRTLRYPNLPCLQVAPKEKRIFLPIEVCEMVEGQHCKKKLEERQNAEMIKFTARDPISRFQEIDQISRRANFNSDPYLKEFGMSVSPKPLALSGRVLEAPNVRYKDDEKIKPVNGQWDMRNCRYFNGADIKNWVLLSFSDPGFCRQNCLENFARMLSQIGSQQGMRIGRPGLIDMIDIRRGNVCKALADIKQKFQPNLIVCVVPGRLKTVYGDVKQAAETMLGLATQCVKDSNIVNCKPALVSNLCQKINAKVGGVNNALTPGETPNILRRPVIIIGADVNHPGPSTDVKPSIAAAVGSLDAYPSRYAVSVRAQRNVDEKKKAIEYILDLKNMVVELLKAFFRSTNGKKPEKIIFYRDGVSEGQFSYIKDKEVTAVREACRSLSPDYQPGITFIVVQKRHHTRFMTQDPRLGVGKMKNIPPGTTVDTAITHPLNFDFFLCSHFGLQGTSRPGHYTVIEDDNSFTSDDLQKLTYYLCHTYVRCTKSVSIPAPVNYAHLAAYRARVHLSAKLDESSSNSDSTSLSDSMPGLPDVVYDAIKVQDMLKSSMYFV